MELVQIAQRAEDLPRAIAFYERLLGIPVAAQFDPPGLAFFVLGKTRLLLDLNAPRSLIYLGVDDVKTTLDELRASGVTIQAEPEVIFSHLDNRIGRAGTDEWMAFITDSEGNTIGLVSWSESA